MFKVVTKCGNLAYAGTDKEQSGVSEQEAEQRAAAMNAKAEALGIKTRYEVVPA